MSTTFKTFLFLGLLMSIWWGFQSRIVLFYVGVVDGTNTTASTTTEDSCDPNVLYRGPNGLPALYDRTKFGPLLEARNFTDGAEIGVQHGYHAEALLRAWPSCRSFKLIDLWAQQELYKDHANVDNNAQEKIFQSAKNRLARFQDKTEFLRMLSVEAAQKIPDTSLDFVYVDARHDYCGVLEDLEAFYPKLRPGAIMAGHDYMDTAEVKRFTPDQDWSICADGSIHKGAVKGAVEHFAEKHGLVITVVYNEGAKFPSWMIQKPTNMKCVETIGAFGSQVTP
jgi:predicted O-methyltransferase YrrM